MVKKLILISLIGAFSIGMAHAGDMSECAKMEDKDKKHFCLASYAGSGTYCDKIINGELRRDCMFKVVKVQREVTYKPPKPKVVEE